MKILFIVNHEIVIYNFRKELVETFISQGHSCYIACPYGEKLEKLKTMGATILDTKMVRKSKNLLTDLKLYRLYKKLIAKVQPNIILTFTIKPNLYGGLAAYKANIPYIINVTGLGEAYSKKGLLKTYIDTFSRYVFKNALNVFVQNDRDYQVVLNKYHPRKLTLIPGSGVNLDEFNYTQFPNTPFNFAFISRIKKEKGIEEFIETAQFFKNKGSSMTFHVCGFLDENYGKILEENHQKGIINYHGFIVDINNFLKDIHFVVFPSYYQEGVPNVLLEAAAMGRINIVTNNPGVKDTIISEETGFYIKDKSSKSIIEIINKIETLCHNKLLEMSLNARYHMENNFSRDIIIKAYQDFLIGLSSNEK